MKKKDTPPTASNTEAKAESKPEAQTFYLCAKKPDCPTFSGHLPYMLNI